MRSGFKRKYDWRCDISRGGRKRKQTNLSSFLTVQDSEMTVGGGNTISQRGSTISHNSAGQLADERSIPDPSAGKERFGDYETEMTVP